MSFLYTKKVFIIQQYTESHFPQKDTFSYRLLLLLETSFVTEKWDATPEKSPNVNSEVVQLEAGEQKMGFIDEMEASSQLTQK